jgi:phage-related baseplate assembly protein
MALSLEQLTTPATKAEIEAAIYASLEARGVPTTSWKAGAVVRTLIVGVSIVLGAFSTMQAIIAKSGFLELSSGDWLSAVAKYVYGVERDGGAFAAGNVELDNAGGGVYAGAAGDLVVATAGGKTYRNTAAFAIAAGQQNVVVPVQADEIGTASTATANTITVLVTTLLGVTVTNPTALVGRDPEADAELRIRCLEKLGSLSPDGPRDAYAFAAKGAKKSDGTSAGVTRVRVIADGSGNVTVYCATASGGITGAVGDLTTALGAVDDAVQKLAAPLAITATVVSAVAVVIAPTYEIWLRDTVGKTAAAVQADIAAAGAAFISTQPIGGFTISPASGTLYKSALEATIDNVHAAHMIKLVVTVPAGDTAIASNEAPVAGAFTATAVNFVSGGAI